MIPREMIGIAEIPGGEQLRLIKHGGDFVIMIGRNELMNTRMRGSEEALATMSCARIAGRANTRLLIGGYGMGFTLRAALAVLPSDAHVTVAELVSEIIDWARGPMQDVTAGCLDDPRVHIVSDDVVNVIRSRPASFDAILLDVDNGPDGLVREDNNQLYSQQGLRAAQAALRPGGVLAIWSAGKDDAFARRLRNVGFAVDEVAVRARGNGKGAKHVIWFANA
ncbi:MAG: spermidine synthase [Thermomicrobiales bacterium]